MKKSIYSYGSPSSDIVRKPPDTFLTYLGSGNKVFDSNTANNVKASLRTFPRSSMCFFFAFQILFFRSR